MSSWITEQQFRESQVGKLGIGLNAAFIQEIKEDSVDFRKLLHDVCCQVVAAPVQAERYQVVCRLSRLLNDLRDELETFFSLEEFFGGFDAAASGTLSDVVTDLRAEHVQLFEQLNSVCEAFEKMVYHETGLDKLESGVAAFEAFYHALQDHERREMGTILRQINEVLGEGD